MRKYLLPAMLLVFSACDKPRVLKGDVRDVFGKVLPGATVIMEGQSNRAIADAEGAFSFEVPTSGKLRLLAGADGYVKDYLAVTVPADEEAPLPKAAFALWAMPPEPGFYGKGKGVMVHLEAAKVTSMGSDLKELHGVRDIPRISFSSRMDPFPILFKSTLRSSEITQLDLALFKLKFLEETELTGITGEEKVAPKLWVADAEVKFTLRGLNSDDVYLITPDEPMADGIYAFASQNILLDTEPGSLASLPAEMQVVHPFEVK